MKEYKHIVCIAALCLAIGLMCFLTACVSGGDSVAVVIPQTEVASVQETTLPPFSEHTPVPGQDEMFRNVADMIQLVFDETVNPANMHMERSDLVAVSREKSGETAYYSYVNTETYEVEHVAMADYDQLPLTDAERAEAEGYDMREPRTIVDHIALEWACTPVARRLVEEKFAVGREITEMVQTFIGSDNVMEPRVQVGINVHMKEGACYTVTLVWPQLVVSEFSVYPLGWDACVHGYQSEADAYPHTPLGERFSPGDGDPVLFDGVPYYYIPIDGRSCRFVSAYLSDLDKQTLIRDCVKKIVVTGNRVEIFYSFKLQQGEVKCAVA